ncbi:MAG: hypothetical protein WD294_03515 [Phycisphaeraceae bacterium]
MPEFFSLHKIGQVSRDAMRERAEKLIASTTDESVDLIRTVCDLEAQQMLCEWVAPSRDAVLSYLEQHDLQQEWLMHVDLEEPPATPPINPEPD